MHRSDDAPRGTPPPDLADLLAAGLEPGDDHAELEDGLDLEAFLTAVPDLELYGCLGRGGMGLVYRARQVRLDRVVAVKLMKPELAANAEFAERFEQEARALARIDHPNIVGVHDFGEAGSSCYLTMEYVDGPNLRAVLESSPDQRLEPSQAVEVAEQVCEALAFAHARGVIHRDIKPENLLMDRRGRVKVADFGLAKLQQGHRHGATRTRILGTPQYMAPEQLSDPRGVDLRADIFAVGVVLYEMLTGQLPIGRFPMPSELGPASTELDEVVLRCLESKRSLRYASAEALLDGLRSLPRGTVDRVTEELEPPGPSKARRYGVAAAVGIAASLGALGLWSRPAPSPPVMPLLSARVPTPPAVVDGWKRTQWPASDLSTLDPSNRWVLGIDWAELRQAPALAGLETALGGTEDARRGQCKRRVLDRTHKLVVGAKTLPAPVLQAVIHGDWSPRDLEPCLYAFSIEGAQVRLTHDADDEATFAIEGEKNSLQVHVAREGTALRLRGARLGPDLELPSMPEVSDGGGVGMVPWLRALRPELDLGASIWLVAEPEPGVFPAGILSAAGHVKIWDEAGLDVALRFDDEEDARRTATLLDAYIRMFFEEPANPDEAVVAQTDGTEVRVHGAFAIPDVSGSGKVGLKKPQSFTIGFSLNPDVDGEDAGRGRH